MNYNVSRGGLQLLQASLSAPGWTTNVQDLYSGGALAKRINDMFLDCESLDRYVADAEDDEARHKASLEWLAVRHDIQVSNREHVLIRACIDYHVENRAMPANPAFVDLCSSLGLVD